MGHLKMNYKNIFNTKKKGTCHIFIISIHYLESLSHLLRHDLHRGVGWI